MMPQVEWDERFSSTGRTNDPLGAGAVRAENHVAFPNALSDCPLRAAGKTSADLGLVGVACEKYRDELFVKRAPFVGKLVTQILHDAEVGADEVFGEALLGKSALLA